MYKQVHFLLLSFVRLPVGIYTAGSIRVLLSFDEFWSVGLVRMDGWIWDSIHLSLNLLACLASTIDSLNYANWNTYHHYVLSICISHSLRYEM